MAKSDLLIRIGANLDNLGSGLAKAEKNLKRFGFKAERIGSQLTSRISLPLIALGGVAVKTFADFDRLEKGLAALNGSAKGGADSFNRLNKVVLDTRTTLDLKTAALGAQRLQGAGLSAEFAERTIKQLGIAATVSGSTIEDVGGVLRQFTQIIGKGKVEQEDFNSILDRMPAIGAILRKEFGTVTAEGIRATGISMEEFVARTVDAIEANESFQGVQGGLAKSFESFGNAVQVGIRPFGEAIAKALNLEKNLERLGNFIADSAQAFSDLSPGLQKFIILTAASAAATGPLFLGLGSVAKALPLLKSGALILGKPLGGITKGLSLLTGAFAQLGSGSIVQRVLGFVGVFAKALAGLKPLFVALTGPIGLTVAAIALIGIGFAKAYKNSQFFRDQIARVRVALKPITSAISELAGRFLPSLSGAFSSLGGVFNVVFGAIGAGISAIIESFLIFIENVTAVGGAISKLFSGDFKGAAQDIANSSLNPAVFIAQAKRVGSAFATTFNETVAGEVSTGAIADNEGGAGGGGRLSAATGGGGGGAPSRNVPKSIQQLSNAAVELSKEAREEVKAFFNEFVVGSSNVDFLQGKLAGLSATPVTIGQPDLLQRQKEVFAEIAEEVRDNLGAALEETDKKTRFFGEGFDGLSEKITATKEALEELYENGFLPTDEIVVKIAEELANLEEKQDSVTQGFGEMSSAMEALRSTSSKAFDAVAQAMSKGESAVKAFGSAVLNSVRDAIAAEIKLSVATQIASALKSVPFPFNVGIAAAAGAGASALFSSALGALNIPALADGAVTTGPQLALIGEAGPEAVIPLDRYESLIRAGQGGGSGSGGGNVEFVIRGEDLVGLLRPATQNYNRF